MNLPEDAAPNLLGALALAVNSRMRAAVVDAAGAGGALAEAVVVIKDQPGSTAEWLGQVLGLTQPGAAHLVRRLVDQGWVRRQPGADGRSRALHLTAAGRVAAERILRARQDALADLVGLLTAEQRHQLARIAGNLLRCEAGDRRELARLCRLCDRSRCPTCPVHDGYRGAPCAGAGASGGAAGATEDPTPAR
ncbi:MarR family transcriptional regulator [Micromonospora sp. C28SCA-DRY-2]|uniref:MarR family winged helix-turn-helix transcriptional regulator n=1 Tax=Micromonospora sp. C28SCA-DRY-2 TaxID=3059522 RepID=UPI002675B38C|nr:MarR family transcriptional regulator [Micromonospora sp. C28SCA-DRY-2]MDO3704960.1 MarR family transcriptional regulator [Micromonospora sp. C28SCA-DRY-2]